MNIKDSGYCRLCAKPKSYHKLVNLQQDEEKRNEIVIKLTRINASTNFIEDILPKVVCLLCTEALDRAFNFVISVEQAEQALKKTILKNIKKEEIYSDSENFDYNEDKYADDVDVKYENVRAIVDLQPPIFNGNDLFLRSSGKVQSKKKIDKSSSLDNIPLSQLKLTWKDYNWICAYCGTQFLDVDELRNHSMQYHNCCNAFRCIDCNIRKLSLNGFLTHVRRHRKSLKLSCYKCGIRFPDITEAKKHRNTHIPSDTFCSGCNSSFTSDEDLKNHVDTFYKRKWVHGLNMQLKNNSTCAICNKNFKNKSSLRTHLLIHTERKREYVCDVCGKCFLHKQNLLAHMTLHNDERPYLCKICKSTFKTAHYLQRHVGTHDGDKPFSCDQCGRCFRLKKQLKSHSIIHTDSLPHVCVFCKKAFRFKTILNQHLRQHTGIRPYSCDICRRDFTNWPNYNKHMKRRHSMNMAKKKHTPEGTYHINPTTGDLLTYPQTNETLNWKKSIMVQRKPGRPKILKDEKKSNTDKAL